MNAYQFATRHPDKVSRLIVEDIGAVVDCDWSFTTRPHLHTFANGLERDHAAS
ncbi:hypothetical protein ACIBQ1_48055 [Nonomuraea sp. NPDC050153]|uniref:hypothetical protein n=1 Tax=Nonomuraea sp. NPDC050153 TaxID=3364359 RepID=UPI0037896925